MLLGAISVIRDSLYDNEAVGVEKQLILAQSRGAPGLSRDLADREIDKPTTLMAIYFWLGAELNTWTHGWSRGTHLFQHLHWQEERAGGGKMCWQDCVL